MKTAIELAASLSARYRLSYACFRSVTPRRTPQADAVPGVSVWILVAAQSVAFKEKAWN